MEPKSYRSDNASQTKQMQTKQIEENRVPMHSRYYRLGGGESYGNLAEGIKFHEKRIQCTGRDNKALEDQTQFEKDHRAKQSSQMQANE